MIAWFKAGLARSFHPPPLANPGGARKRMRGPVAVRNSFLNVADLPPVRSVKRSGEAGPNKRAHDNARGLRVQAAPPIYKSVAKKNQERESSESPILNAFCRVAPSVLFNFLAILAAAVFFFANDFNSRTSVAVQARRFFDFLAINPPFQERQTISLSGGGRKHNRQGDVIRS